MASNNPLDVSGAVHRAGLLATPLVDGALVSHGTQQNARPESDFSGISAGQVPLPVSSVEAELLSAHAAGAMFSNGLGVPEPVAGPKVEDLAQAASDRIFQQDAAYRETAVKTEDAQDNGDKDEDDDHNDGDEEAATTRRNKSTRPRKNVDFLSGGFFSDELSEEEAEFEDDGEDDEYDPDAEDEPQKKRGRPKSTTEYTATGEPKRKRGRPRKNPLDVPAVPPSETDGEPKVKRKRGRPRKIRPEELQEDAEGVPVPAAVAAVAAMAADAKPGNEGSQEVDLGPIIMSNLNEANIDPNLDPSLYSNADASVYSPVGSSPRLVSISLSPVSHVKRSRGWKDTMSSGLDHTVSDSPGVSSGTPSSLSTDTQTKLQEQRLGQILEDVLNAEIASVAAATGSTSASPIVESNEQVLAPTMPVKRKRGRPRKGEEIKARVESEENLRRSDRKAVSTKRDTAEQKQIKRALKALEKQERRLSKKLRKNKVENSATGEAIAASDTSGSDDNAALLDDQSLDSADSDDISDDSSSDEYKARKSLLKHHVAKIRKTPKPREPKLPKERKTPLERRAKKGRPSKQEKVTKNIVSIFKASDGDLSIDLANDIAASEKQEKKTPALNSRVAAVALNFDNKGQSTFSDIPIVSGIRNPEKPDQNPEPEEVTKFVPLPVPEVDPEGKIVDPTYIDTYLPGVIIHNDEEGTGRLIDERAFFLEGSEGYFEQHNLRFRPSASSLALNAPSLGFEEFAPFIELELLVHRKERDALAQLHKSLYHQWCFELSQGYSLNFFGVGSKTKIVMDFLEDYFVSWYHDVICEGDEPVPPIMVVNGYNPGTKLKAVLHDMTAAVVATSFATTVDADDSRFQPKMPKHVSEAFPFLVEQLKRQEARNQKNRVPKASLVLVIHNLDGEAFRDQRSQNLLSQLALLPNVWVIVSTDNVNLGLLWDLNRFKNFNFLWHNVTSYEPYTVEMSFKDVLSMGQSKKFIGSRGAKYVLASLTANAQKLYEVLLHLQMDALKAATATKAGRTGLKGSSKNSVELRAVYDKCVEKFIVSNEVNFKTMLHEYVEHKMCVVTKNSAGHEVVYVPFALDEMTKLTNEEFRT